MATLYGTPLNDWLPGELDLGNLIFGFAGDDALFGGYASDWLDGGEGRDLLMGYGGGDFFAGGADDDTMLGGADGIDVAIDELGNNWFDLGFGSNQVYAGTGRDTVVVTGFTTVTPPNADVFTLKTAAYPYSVNWVVSGADDDIVRLTEITGADPATASASPGTQVVFAGEGNDWVEISAPTAVIAYGEGGNDVLWKTDLRTEWYYLASGDRITADSIVQVSNVNQDPLWTVADILSGGDGNDTIVAGDGPDWVYGDAGDDWLDLGAGANVAFAGDGSDTIVVKGFAWDRVVSHLPPSSVGTYSFSTNAIWAGPGDDIVTISNVAGPTYAMAVNGEEGNDLVRIETTGSSIVSGGSGNDSIATVGAFSSFVYVQTYATPADSLWGDEGDDLISGGRGDDLLVGGSDRDWLFGGQGDDALYGGTGTGDDGVTDRFSFEDPRERVSVAQVWYTDTVWDFQPASRYGAGAVGASDKSDVAALLQAYDTFNWNGFARPSSLGAYGPQNPFDEGWLRLSASGNSTEMQLNISADTGVMDDWRTFLVLYDVLPGELDTTTQADLSGGLAGASGGDFLWFTG